MRLRVISLLVIISSLAMGQGKYDANWCFGVKAGINFSDTAHPANFNTLCNNYNIGASISDSLGNLLYYIAPDTPFAMRWFDGLDNSIYNNNNEVIPNGNKITTGARLTNALFIPVPGKENEYLLFYMNWKDTSFLDNTGQVVSWEYNNLLYTRIKRNNGVDTILEKNILASQIPMEWRMAAVKHANGKDWWIMAHESNLGIHNTSTNVHLCFLITQDSIWPPIQQFIGYQHGMSEDGNMVFSKNGNYLASALDEDLHGDLFTFDRCTGVLSNYTDLQISYTGDIAFCEFSEDEKRLYFVESAPPYNAAWKNTLYQYSLDASQIALSKQIIWADSIYDNTLFNFGAVRLAPNNKIYMCTANPAPYGYNYYNPYIQNLWVINSPDSSGAACDFQPLAYYLGDSARSYYSLPNMPNYNLGAITIYQADAGGDTSLCNSDTTGIRIGIPAVTGVTYSWQGTNINNPTLAQPTVKPTQSSWYYVTLTDTSIRYSCQSRTDTVYVEVRNCCDTALLSQVSAGIDTAYCRDSLPGAPIGVPPVAGVAYQWYPPAGLDNANAAQPTATPDASTYYVLTAVDTSVRNLVCPAKTDTVLVRVENCDTTGVNEINLPLVKVYPNPASNELVIEASQSSKLPFRLYDIVGHPVIEIYLTGSKTILDISSLSQGIYFYRTASQSGKVQVLR